MPGWSKAWASQARWSSEDWEDRVAGKDEPLSREDLKAWAREAAAYAETVAECALKPLAAFVAGMPRVIEVEFAYGHRDERKRQRNHRRWRDRR